MPSFPSLSYNVLHISSLVLLSLLVLLAGAAGLYLHTRLARLQAALDSQAVLLAAPRPHLSHTAKPVQHSNGQPAGTNGRQPGSWLFYFYLLVTSRILKRTWPRRT